MKEIISNFYLHLELIKMLTIQSDDEDVRIGENDLMNNIKAAMELILTSIAELSDESGHQRV